MADQPVSSQQVVNVAAPPTVAVAHFVITSSVAELLITCATSRIGFDQATNMPIPKPIPDWFMSLSMSTTMALQLRDALNTTLVEYEKRFGLIPRDPTVNAVVP